MSEVFYYSVIHGLGFFICFMIQILRAQNNKTRLAFSMFCTLIKHGFLTNQSARRVLSISVIKANKPLGMSVEHSKSS